MTLNLALATRALTLDGIETSMLVGSGTAELQIFQHNTELAVFELAAAPFGSAVNDGIAVASCPISSTGTEVAGKATRFVLVNQNADTVLTGTISGIGGGGDIETPNLTVTAAATQTLNSFVIRMSATGALSVEASLTLV